MKQRYLADAKTPDQVVLPGSQSATVAGVPQPPILETPKPPDNSAPITPAEAPKVPPPPPAASTKPPTFPPLGTGTAKVASTPPRPLKRRRPIRRTLQALVLLLIASFTGGVYYSFISDDFHDFFTEHVPFGEQVVAYFEEREFKKRFPLKDQLGATWPQTRGEEKVTISRASGMTPRVAQVQDEPKKSTSDLGSSGPHTSALADKPVSKDPVPAPAKNAAPPAPKKEDPKPAAPAKAASTVDHINVQSATEPVVQDLVKMVNNIITTINASPEAAKYSSTLASAKADLDKIIGEIVQLKQAAQKEASEQIAKANTDFDAAAKELVRRVEGEMRDEESRWREEFTTMQEALSSTYREKLQTEVKIANELADAKRRNELLEQEIALQKKFEDSIKASVEAERDGRLAKLDQLSSSVSELEQLTGQWNDVVDANLQTQHLHVALDAVRNAIEGIDHPTPFVNQLVTLKEVSKDNEVVSAAIASISPSAYQRGVATPAHLVDRFRRVAAEVRKASLLPENAGVASHAASALVSRLMFSKKSERGLPEGDDVESTLARTETLLEEGDLEAAAREMNGLKGWAGVLSRDWVAEARKVLEVRQAVDVSRLSLIMRTVLTVPAGHEHRSTTAESSAGLDRVACIRKMSRMLDD